MMTHGQKKRMRALFVQQDPFTLIGVMLLSSILKKEEYETDVVITSVEGDWLETALSFGPDLVALSCTTGAHTQILSLAEKIKVTLPQALVVLGGNHATLHPDIITHPAIDIVVIGEAETAMGELAACLACGREYAGIGNLHVKEGGAITKNPPRPLRAQLDMLPFPDIHLYDKYGEMVHTSLYWLVMGRGCSHRCSFCYNTAVRRIYGADGPLARTLRWRSMRNVLEELRLAKTKWPLKSILFMDDVFTYLPRAELSPFLSAYGLEIGLPFTCCSRPEVVTDALVSELKEGGCVGIMMGIESGNEYINREIYHKEVTPEQVIRAADIIHRHGLRLQTFSMLGAPGESLSTAMETLRLNQRLKPDFARCSMVQPYPLTPLMDYCQSNSLLIEGFGVDDFEASYFFDSPIRFEDRHQVLRLQKSFDFCVRFPFFTDLVKRLVAFFPENRFVDSFFDILFKANYSFSTMRFYGIGLIPFLKTGLRTKNSFLQRKRKAGPV